ncbi:AAA family ATPase [Cellulomonas palmilytica]|uniref:AAA family ATPase n=1 Tax=Cellulomonas palmilytica TaxID=2608402 RepID=UPI001F29B76E|nr:AAA family ATPase [Cellulomonas palmilytica]UJP39687.1 AAA family ATPase [Cellulomonas palmilytica]
MILWLNGAFGVGKTTCATQLAARRPHTRTHDPEALGWWLSRTVGRVTGVSDYQDLRAWRRGTVRATSRRADGTDLVVVPMSLLDAAHADEVLGGLAARGHEVRHVTLHASPDELLRRIDADTTDPGARAWRRTQVARYSAAADHLAARGPVVATDGRTPDEVARAVLAHLP